MQTITLARPWTYRTPLKTIDYPAGEHSVFQYIADAAEAEGAITTSGTPDPLDGSIPQIAEYLAGISDAGELRRMREAEVGGKTRKGAIGAIDSRLAEIEAE